VPMYRLLALDLDGTLLRHDHSVDDRDLAVIRELQRAGVTVTIVTGRLLTGSISTARACAIEGAIACVEGSHLVDLASNETIVHHPIEPAIAGQVRSAFVDHGLASFVFDATGIHHDHAGAPYANYVATWSPNLRVVEDEVAWQTEPLAAVAIGDEAAVRGAAERLRAHASNLFSVHFAVSMVPGKYCVLARAAGRSKGTALRELCARIGCTPEDAVAVGDWMNDVPMFEVAGRSFVMGSAPDVVAAAATDRLTAITGAGGGIAEAVRRAWG
jgi:Cof subfamily protein (haloacid dehalogenase superfamily)